MPTVNGLPAETGCYIDGHWGQYGPDRLAEIAEGFGWTPDDSWGDPRDIRRYVDAHPDGRCDYEHCDFTDESDAWQLHHESADAIVEWLNDHTAVVCKVCARVLEYDELYGGFPHAHAGELCDGAVGAADPQRFTWHWHDGEFFLPPICDDPDECEDETCAHWD